jgi:hypothetical protein
MLDWRLELERLTPDVRAVSVSFGGDAGDWNERIPLELVDIQGVPARRVTSADIVDGIRVTANAVASTADATAIEIAASDDDAERKRRYVMGTGPDVVGARGMRDDAVVLRDDRGRIHRELVSGVPGPGAVNASLVRFAGVPDDAAVATLEIPSVLTQEQTDEIALLVPGETEVAVAGCIARIRTSRVAETEPRIRVDVTPSDAAARRQLRHFMAAFVAGETQIGMNIVHAGTAPPYVTAPDPSGTASSITVRGALVRVAGPWRLEIPLTRSG